MNGKNCENAFYESILDIENKLKFLKMENQLVFMHFHKSLEIICLTNGKAIAGIGNKSCSLEKGDIAFIAPGVSHYLKPLEENAFTTLIIPENYYKFFSDLINFEKYSFLTNKTINKEILCIINNIEKFDNVLLQLGQISSIFGIIQKNYETNEFSSKTNELIESVIKYINENYSEKITLSNLADKFGYSKYYFSHLFNKMFGCNLKTYINTVRHYNLHKNDNSSITENILSVGFNDTSTYYKFLKKNNK